MVKEAAIQTKKTPLDFDFTADQIGSEVLERFSKDIYTPRAILRELVKNAHDSYVELEKFIADEGLALTVNADDYIVKVDVTDDSILIKDEGIGLDVPGFKKLISIALTDKRDMEGVTGFRGIGFWSAYAAGDSISIESTKLGEKKKYTLRMNTKQMRKLQAPDVPLLNVMNDPTCVKLTAVDAGEDEHGTTIKIHARSDSASFASLLKAPATLKDHLLETCSCRLDKDSALKTEIEAFYASLGITPTRLFFQGGELFRKLPAGLGSLQTTKLALVKDKKTVQLAEVWYATNTANKSPQTQFAGIRLHREAFPIGSSNPYSERKRIGSEQLVSRADLLSWHVGEVHLVHGDLRPDAAGEGLRDSATLPEFVEQLRVFYEDTLMVIGRAKQLRATKRKEYEARTERLGELLANVKAGTALTDEEKAEVDAISKVKATDDRAGQGSKPPGGTKMTHNASVVRDPSVKAAMQATGTLIDQLQKAGALTVTATPRPKKGSSPTPPATPSTPAAQPATAPKSTNATAAPPAARATVLAIIDDVRDLAETILEDEDVLKDEFIKAIDGLAAKYLE